MNTIKIGKSYTYTYADAFPESLRGAEVVVIAVDENATADQLAVQYSFIDTAGNTGEGTMQLAHAEKYLLPRITIEGMMQQAPAEKYLLPIDTQDRITMEMEMRMSDIRNEINKMNMNVAIRHAGQKSIDWGTISVLDAVYHRLKEANRELSK